MKNYKVDFKNKTIIIANDFANRANSNVNSNEYKEMRQLLNDYPTYTVKYRKSVVSTKESHKDLTFKHMREYIKMFELDNDPASLDEFEEIKAYHTKTTSTPYVKVKSWFLAKYPEYKITEQAYEATIKLIDESTLNTGKKENDIDTVEAKQVQKMAG